MLCRRVPQRRLRSLARSANAKDSVQQCDPALARKMILQRILLGGERQRRLIEFGA